MKKRQRLTLFVFCLLSLSACQQNRVENNLADPESASLIGHQITRIAKQQVGVPYIYGGTSPAGFDCSGLVQFSYQRVGIQLPRTAYRQFRSVKRIPQSQLRPGDLIFFSLDGKRVSHVGIYYRDQVFIHAPKPGRKVSYEYLNNDYWQARFVAAGRVKP